MLAYTLQIALLHLLLYGAYHFLLRRRGLWHANRYFLLTVYGAVILLPLLPVPSINWPAFLPESEVVQNISFPEKPEIYTVGKEVETSWKQSQSTAAKLVATSGKTETSDPASWPFGLVLIYGCGFLGVGLVYLRKVLSLRLTLRNRQPIPTLPYLDIFTDRRIKLYVLPATKNFAATHGSCIYVSPNLLNAPELEMILAHEYVHASQHHSRDLLMAEFFTALLWWSPATWLHRRSLRENLEFISDAAVLQAGNSRKSYQFSLLRFCARQTPLPMLSFTQSPLKTRISMMKIRPGSGRTYAALLGLVFLLSLGLTACLEQSLAEVPTLEEAQFKGRTEIFLTAMPNTEDLKQLSAAVEAAGGKLLISLPDRKIPSITIQRGDERSRISLGGIQETGTPIRFLIDQASGECVALYSYDPPYALPKQTLSLYTDGSPTTLPPATNQELRLDPAEWREYGIQMFRGDAAWEEAQAYLTEKYLDARIKYYYNEYLSPQETMEKPAGVEYVKVRRLPGLPAVVHVMVSDQRLSLVGELEAENLLERTKKLVTPDPDLGMKYSIVSSRYDYPFEQLNQLLDRVFIDATVQFYVEDRPVDKSTFYQLDTEYLLGFAYAKSMAPGSPLIVNAALADR